MNRTLSSTEDVFSSLPILETERLVLRPLTLDDAQDMFEYASDPEVTNYTTWEPHRTIEDSINRLNFVLSLYNGHEVADWGIEHKADQKLIGTCAFMYWSSYHARAEIGYAMSRRYWGQGLMTEAVRAVIAFGFERMGLNRIEARCVPENIASARVMEKNGMSYEGILRGYTYSKGSYHDLKLYSVLRNEWGA